MEKYYLQWSRKSGEILYMSQLLPFPTWTYQKSKAIKLYQKTADFLIKDNEKMLKKLKS